MPGLLVVDDDPSIALVVEQAAQPLNLAVHTAATGRDATEQFARHRPDLVVLDHVLPDATSVEVLERLHRLDAKAPIIVVTSRGASSTAIEAMRGGAFEFLTKPLHAGELRQLLARALEVRRLMHVPVEVSDSADATSGADLLVGRSPAMQQVYKSIGRVAQHDLPVLIHGETGVGKQLVARAIYHYGARSKAPFRVLDCGAAEGPAIEAELLGASDASNRKGGLLEQCRGGTLLLKNIEQLPPPVQGLIVRQLQHDAAGSQTREDASPAVRILATTAHDLDRLAQSGMLRLDLYYLLSSYCIGVAPLRDRTEDIGLLARHFLFQQSAEFGKRIYRIAGETLEAMRSFAWPGNCRQLQGVIRQAVLRASGAVLLPDFFPPELLALNRGGPAHDARLSETDFTFDFEAFIEQQLSAGSHDIYDAVTAETDKRVLTLLLRHTEGNQAKAAQLLGMTRSSLRAKLRALGIVIQRSTDVHAEHPADNLS